MTFSPFMSIRISLPLSILSLTSLPGTYVPIGTLYRLLLYRIVLSFRTVLVTLSVGNDHKEGTGLKYCFSRANTSAGTFLLCHGLSGLLFWPASPSMIGSMQKYL